MKIQKTLSLLLILSVMLTSLSFADTEEEMNRDADKALAKFFKEVKGAEKFLTNAKGYIVFKDIKEVGFFMGGKYGEGVLRVGNVTKGYLSITSASVGFQMGVQKYSMVVAITSDAILKELLKDDNSWESDLDANIALAKWNAEEERDDTDMGSSLVGFVFNSKGMMGNVTFEGTHFSTITPDISQTVKNSVTIR